MLEKDKLLGGVYGLAIGDALGVPVEFKDRAYMERNPIGDRMIGYGTYNQPVGTWSDDTSMTISTMDMMSAGGLSTGMIMDAFSKWYTKGAYTPFGECFDIGGTTRQAIENFLRGEDPDNCGLDDEMSNGNGSLMRMLPMIYYTYLKHGVNITQQAVEDIYRVSSLTHANMVSKVACVYYVYIGINILLYGNTRVLQNCVKEGIMAVEEYFSDKEHEYQYILQYTGMESLEESLELEEDDIKSTGFVVDSLEASIWCLYSTGSYKEAVLKAVNLGGDTDTIGAITGSLAGIYYGIDNIHTDWRANLQGSKKIENIVNRFYDQYK
jgi:ADP-ribosyl-[dinitrogen reductase] hydrolase